jgi:phosphoribosylformimino-5-aminoimidazole carboxamide ribotide isomerase
MLPARTRPRIIPVLDVMHGQVVRAAGGVREKYQPIACPFTSSRKPYDVASALLQLSGANELYVADLDAITGQGSVSRAVQTLLEACRVPTWLDAGIGRNLVVSDLPVLPHVRPVIGSETCGTPEVLLNALDEAGSRSVALSIDMKGGRLLGHSPAWREQGVFSDADVLEMAAVAVKQMGVGTLILIDLADVGAKAGPSGTEYWCRKIAARMPGVDLIAGGGVRNWDDVDRLGEAGATGVLVASALHDGTLKAT